MLAQSSVTGLSHYQTLLSSYLNNSDENGLAIAYDIGRNQLRSAAGLLDLAETHQQALSELLDETGHSRLARENISKAASCFLREALSPFEVARLSSRDSTDSFVRLYDVFEREAKRIAHRLHDESAQMLAVVYLELAEIARQSSAETAERLQGVSGLLDEICAQLRSLSHELRPIVLDQLGLMPALKQLLDGVESRSALTIRLLGDTEGRLDPDIETVLYRSVQEAFNNICRHANASYVEVHIQREVDMIYCSVRDNGDGFRHSDSQPEGSSGLGLIGIQERVKALGGSCKISSKPGFGTILQVAVPL